MVQARAVSIAFPSPTAPEETLAGLAAALDAQAARTRVNRRMTPRASQPGWLGGPPGN
jgi:hypothetical protein